MFGTDWPYAVLPPAGGDPAPELSFLGLDRLDVEAGNAAALVLPRPAAAVPGFRRVSLHALGASHFQAGC